MNEVLRRGGKYRNGAYVAYFGLDHPDIVEFIQAPRHDLPWAKRCVDINQEMWDNFEHKEVLYEGIKSGDIWLCKTRKDAQGKELFSNVCLEVIFTFKGHFVYYNTLRFLLVSLMTFHKLSRKLWLHFVNSMLEQRGGVRTIP